jgi:hypothetical protein
MSMAKQDASQAQMGLGTLNVEMRAPRLIVIPNKISIKDYIIDESQATYAS